MSTYDEAHEAGKQSVIRMLERRENKLLETAGYISTEIANAATLGRLELKSALGVAESHVLVLLGEVQALLRMAQRLS